MSPILELHLFTRTTPKLQDSCVKSTHLHHGKTLIFSSKVCFEPGSPGIPGGRNTLSPHFFSITKVRRGKRLHFLTCSNLETPCLPSDRFLSQEQDTFWGLGTQVFTHGAGLFFKAETQLFTEIGFATYVSRGPSRCLSSTFLLSNPNWPLLSLFWPSEFESKQSQRIWFFLAWTLFFRAQDFCSTSLFPRSAVHMRWYLGRNDTFFSSAKHTFLLVFKRNLCSGQKQTFLSCFLLAAMFDGHSWASHDISCTANKPSLGCL